MIALPAINKDIKDCKTMRGLYIYVLMIETHLSETGERPDHGLPGGVAAVELGVDAAGGGEEGMEVLVGNGERGGADYTNHYQTQESDGLKIF